MVSKIQSNIINHLAEITGYDKSEIMLSSSLTDELGLDSMMLIDFHRLVTKDFPELRNLSLERLLTLNELTVQNIIDIILEELGLNNIEKKHCYIDCFPEVVEFENYLGQLNQVPYFKQNYGVASNIINIDNQEKINYSTYNYLGINGSTEINNSVIRAINTYGTSVSGSRLLSGEIPLHSKLEDKIANFLGVDAAIVQVGGHSTNVNVIGNIVNDEDLILHDSLAHNSIIQGAILSHAKRKPFKHNDMNHLENELKRLRKKFRRVLIIVEGVYSMDGDICNLPELIKIKKEYGALLMIDEAHSIGTIGRNGRGVTSYYNIDPTKVDILMGTLSKSLNSCGGYIAGSHSFINYLKYNSPGFIFSVGMTPANTAAAYTSLNICDREDLLFKRLRENSQYFLNNLKALGLNTGLSKDTPIIPLIIGDTQKAIELSERLYEKGINALPIVYPAVKESESRLRFFISAAHTKENIDFTISVLSEELNLLTKDKVLLTQ
ncbi:aminotransferase class I/II-fold pyridoxal phosphate-dependent enzyme [Bacillus mojavensis]|uniref:aminotransferase class I/II-fold pyridoxal phosphate-dependent enzyme n=1 Tax=Bacillus mojavensis TaxID=72360 RepID=UPI002DB5E784|nr:aminotransferase class I/II-fold pyridoxal phosphate-dependent enzyme [Bacillus mojavensis]MEC1738544.1 aminotransferase class I/II-fold pyridoxal phosphate-dependent enzyme [Bacillus mojavensis]MEC1795108.1 aminotransferase class I/II-fold pyridoxal phosphate-dependent enzyme [Bacillus mojavensis]